ncbi:MAG: Endo-1,4-beta-xylanase C precursor [candidate division BRC1 bacterium ADurb.BinA364]|nr:MAG: Endo-1,4-beta-xylanase C precursor [candidate division BRC1 bacterium ADurb.BinA364]
MGTAGTNTDDLLQVDCGGNAAVNTVTGGADPDFDGNVASVVPGAMGVVNYTGVTRVILTNQDFPAVVSVAPADGAYLGLAPVPAWGTVRVTFDKAVTGVDAGDLTLNGVPAGAVAQGADASIWDFSSLPWPAAAGQVAMSIGPAIQAAVGGTPMTAAYAWTVSMDNIPIATATQTFVAPTLDGVLNPGEWQGTPIDLTYVVTGDEVNISGPADLSAKMYVNYDAKWLYLGFDIADDVIANIPVSGSHWLNDSIEIFFDSDMSRSNNNAAPGGQYRIVYDNQVSGNSDNAANFSSSPTAEWYGVAAVNATGWATELRFSLERIGEPVAPVLITDMIGFGIQLNDNDTGTRNVRLCNYLPPIPAEPPTVPPTFTYPEVSGRSDRWGYLNFGPWTPPPAAASHWQIFE